MVRLCNKCGTPVLPNNDACRLEYLRTGDPTVMVFGTPRHVLPIVEDGETICEGSPSRAQYLEGQPTDPRGVYGYHHDLEEPFRQAFAQMQLDSANAGA